MLTRRATFIHTITADSIETAAGFIGIGIEETGIIETTATAEVRNVVITGAEIVH
jgi:hypothetical protein